MTTTRSGFTKLAAVCIAILLGAVVWELGWPLTRAEHEWSRLIAAVATLGHLTGILGSYFRKEINRPSLRLLIFQIISCLMIFLLIAREQQEAGYMRFTELSRLVITAGLIAIPTLMSLTRIFEWLVGKQKKGRPLMAPAMQFVASLGVVILAGTGLLLLPNSTYPGITLSFTDALFTSTSAVCVTGLNAVDFAHTFTPLGEMFTLALIQIGGFGIMTFAYFVAMVAGQGFSLRDRVLLTDLLDEDNLGAVVSFITTIVVSTLFIELCGTVLLYFSWEGKDINLMGEPLWWHSLFHSVSAFCNAGFSTFPMNLMEPGIRLCYSGQAVIMALIVCGGLGFGIYKEINSRLANRFFFQTPPPAHAVDPLLQTGDDLHGDFAGGRRPGHLCRFLSPCRGTVGGTPLDLPFRQRHGTHGGIQYQRLRPLSARSQPHYVRSDDGRRQPRRHGRRHENHYLRHCRCGNPAHPTRQGSCGILPPPHRPAHRGALRNYRGGLLRLDRLLYRPDLRLGALHELSGYLL